MDSSELYDRFRSDVVDQAAPYLWTETEVFGYMNDAYRMFVRKTGGITDFTSDATAVDIIAGESVGILDPSILRITHMNRRSDFGDIEIINFPDLAKKSRGDYGMITPLKLDDTTGIVRYGIIGMQRHTVRWINIPEVDDVADMMIFRLPFDRLTDFGQEISEVDEDHHIHLLDGMKALAYRKQDVETFNLEKATTSDGAFLAYCAFVKAELEREKYKVRTVAYGGI